MLLIPATLAVAGLGTLWGGHNSYVAVRNLRPVEMTCADYVRDRPVTAWLKLTRCDPDFGRIGVERERERVGTAFPNTTGVYIPLRPAGQAKAQPAHLVVFSEDPAALLLTSTGHDDFIAQLAVDLSTSTEGLVQSQLDVSALTRRDLQGLQVGVAQDFTLIKHHGRPPALWYALGELALGLGACGLLARRYRRWSRRRPVVPPRARIVRG